MNQVENAQDLNGRTLLRGDTVTSIGGDMTGKIRDIISDDGALFIEVRRMYQYAGKGVWHAADRVLWLSRPKPTNKPAASAPKKGPRLAKARK